MAVRTILLKHCPPRHFFRSPRIEWNLPLWGEIDVECFVGAVREWRCFQILNLKRIGEKSQPETLKGNEQKHYHDFISWRLILSYNM